MNTAAATELRFRQQARMELEDDERRAARLGHLTLDEVLDLVMDDMDAWDEVNGHA